MTFKTNFYNIDFTDNINLPDDNNEIIKRINDIINNLEALKITGDQSLLDETISAVSKFSKDKKNFLVFGTGGSNLGGKALINIMQEKDKKVQFFDNIDPLAFSNFFNKIETQSTGFIFISKSGSTPETLCQLACLIELFDKKNGLNIFFKNSLFITEDKKSPLHDIALKNKCHILYHSKKIGGRYSVFSNVGMVPALLAGMDVKQIHKGAQFQINNYLKSDYCNIGQFFRYQNINENLGMSVIMTYSDALFFFGKWYLQLWAESLGKDLKGITAIHAVGTTDQHSQLQLFLDGPQDKFFTFISTNHLNKGLSLHRETMENNDLEYLVNKKMGDLMHAEQQATIDTFKLRKISFRQINIDEINEFSIGRLMAFSIIETISACVYFDVNPFDQPAVEQGKILTKKYLS